VGVGGDWETVSVDVTESVPGGKVRVARGRGAVDVDVALGVAVDEGVKVAPGVGVKDGVAVVLGEGTREAVAVAMRVGNGTAIEVRVTG
jgi:hypothetical protein